MTRECVTHHHACDCREAKFKELEAELLDKVQGMLERGKEIRELKAELAELRGHNDMEWHWADLCCTVEEHPTNPNINCFTRVLVPKEALLEVK